MSNIKCESWLPTCNRFVAFLDIMGFKDMVARKNHEEVLELLEKLAQVEEVKSKIQNLDERVDIFKFSDSILILSDDDSIETCKSFITVVRTVFYRAIELGLPLKGSIAYGKMTFNKNKNIVFGQPLIDAYLLEEELAYYGVISHNSFDAYRAKYPEENYIQGTFILKKTPFKSCEVIHNNLDWFAISRIGILKKSLKETLDDLYLTVSGAPRKYIDNTIKICEELGYYN